jgi:hypothetical protein
MSGGEERELKDLRERLVRLEVNLPKTIARAFWQAGIFAHNLTAEPEAGDSDNEELKTDVPDPHTLVRVETAMHAEVVHQMFHDSLNSIYCRLVALESVLTETAVNITGNLSRLWTKHLLSVSLSTCYVEAKAKSIGIMNGFNSPGEVIAATVVPGYGAATALISNRGGISRKERTFYNGKKYKKIAGAHNPQWNGTFSKASREGVGDLHLQDVMSTFVERIETVPKVVTMTLGVLKQRPGILLADVAALGNTEPDTTTHFWTNTTIIRTFDVQYDAGTAGSYPSEEGTSSGTIDSSFARDQFVIEVAELAVLFALKRNFFGVGDALDSAKDALEEITSLNDTVSNVYAKFAGKVSNYIRQKEASDAVKHYQDNAKLGFGDVFLTADQVAEDKFLARIARQGKAASGRDFWGTHTYFMSTTGLTQTDSFKRHSKHSVPLKSDFVDYTPRVEYNTRIHTGAQEHSLFGFDTVEYYLRGVNTGLDLFVDSSAAFWRDVGTPTETAPKPGQGDALTLNGTLFAFYDYAATSWKWVRDETGVIS